MYEYFCSHERKILCNSYVETSTVSFNLFSSIAAFNKHHMFTDLITLKRRWHNCQKKKAKKDPRKNCKKS